MSDEDRKLLWNNRVEGDLNRIGRTGGAQALGSCNRT